jgi:hypothetical protein
MNSFLLIESERFPVLPGEEDDLVNPGTYGRALGEYLQRRLGDQGYATPLLCAEDWGWWLEVRRDDASDGILIYAHPEDRPPRRYAVSSEARPGRRWRWSRFGFEDRTAWCDRLRADLEAAFAGDPEVEVRGWKDEFPW